MRRADVAVAFGARVEVVVHPVHAAGGEALGLIGREQAEAGADLQAVLVLDLGDDRLDRLDLAFVRAAGGNYDAVRLRLALGRGGGAASSFSRFSRL